MISAVLFNLLYSMLGFAAIPLIHSQLFPVALCKKMQTVLPWLVCHWSAWSLAVPVSNRCDQYGASAENSEPQVPHHCVPLLTLAATLLELVDTMGGLEKCFLFPQ
jgi:hypothetical protein